jgi:hypothetical protein
VWAVYGYDKDDFVLERVTGASGISNRNSVTANSGVCYWFSNDGRVMAFNGRETYDGQGVVPLTNKLDWWAEIGKIQLGGDHNIMWSGGRLWLNLEAGGGETVDRWMFVWDPEIRALTRYDHVVTEMFDWQRLGAEADPLFLFDGDNNMLRYDPAYETDRFTPDTIDDVDDEPILDVDLDALRSAELDDFTTTRIDGYYRTAWITAGETATRKRWKRPRVTAASTGDATIGMDVFHNFQEETTSKTTAFEIDVEDGVAWGTLLWGDVWGNGEDEVYKFQRQPSAGTGYAVQFKFYSNNNVGRWWVDSVAIPFRRKQVK